MKRRHTAAHGEAPSHLPAGTVYPMWGEFMPLLPDGDDLREQRSALAFLEGLLLLLIPLWVYRDVVDRKVEAFFDGMPVVILQRFMLYMLSIESTVLHSHFHPCMLLCDSMTGSVVWTPPPWAMMSSSGAGQRGGAARGALSSRPLAKRWPPFMLFAPSRYPTGGVS